MLAAPTTSRWPLKPQDAQRKVLPLGLGTRDNLPDPTASAANPYVPTNGPAVGDLFDLFDFSSAGGTTAGPSGERPRRGFPGMRRPEGWP